ncbi:hypothetical protein CLU96_4702 [Chryseobacterium sp. 52]|nr:hypothetical protein CLU96_4702 [Chryseobacterium sp. 52]
MIKTVYKNRGSGKNNSDDFAFKPNEKKLIKQTHGKPGTGL